jgi:hypothetical protein
MIDTESQTDFVPEIEVVYLEKEENKPTTRNKSKIRKSYVESDDEDEIVSSKKKTALKSTVPLHRIPYLMENVKFVYTPT